MSRDFSPQQCWYVNKQFPGLYLSNIRISLGGKEEWMFTETEMEDRKAHPYIAVLGCDIYRDLRNRLTKESFETLNKLLGKLVKADETDSDLSGFPEEVKSWYFNSNNHYYREPNDEAFLEYALKKYSGRKEKA